MSQLSDALVVERGVAIELLMLDPRNPRFETPVTDDETRFDTEEAQNATKTRLGQEQFGVRELVESIRQIGFLRVDNIVVRELQNPGNTDAAGTKKYLVIEGNRRVAAVKSILVDTLHRPITPQLQESISRLDVLVFKPETCGMAFENARDILQGVRHISGIRGWGPYEQAIALRGIMNAASTGNRQTQVQAAATVGLSVLEVNIDLNALGAYEQMKNDDEYGPKVNPRLFSYFVEAVKKPAIRTWLQFNSDRRECLSDENRKLFYAWITPDDNDFQKIHDAQDVRRLIKILSNPAALAALSNEDQIGIEAAVGMASTPSVPPAIDWGATLESIVHQLTSFPATCLSSEADMALLSRIDEIVSDLLGRSSPTE